MPALIAVINKSERRVRLDPAFGLGDGVTCQDGDEVRLLRTSEFGHLGEYAQMVARSVRRAGWQVDVRDCSDLQPRSARVVGGRAGSPFLNRNQIAHAATIIATDLVSAIGDVRTVREDQTKTYNPPQPLAPPAVDEPLTFTGKPPPGGQYRCRVCGHVTFSRYVLSHVKNIGHNDWERGRREPDGTFTPAQAQACPPEPTGSASSTSDQRPNGYTHPATTAALQALPDRGTP